MWWADTTHTDNVNNNNTNVRHVVGKTRSSHPCCYCCGWYDRKIPFVWLLVSHLLLAMAAFQMGVSMNMTNNTIHNNNNRELPPSSSCPPCDRIQQQQPMDYHLYDRQRHSNHGVVVGAEPSTTLSSSSSTSTTSSIKSDHPTNKNETRSLLFLQQHFLPLTMQKLFVGMARVQRDEFAHTFDVGVPLLPSSEGNQDVLILYSDTSSLPHSVVVADSFSATGNKSSIPFIATSEEATRNCKSMNMIFLKPHRKNHCVALMGQWPSPVVYKWMRTTTAASASENGGDGQLLLASLEHPPWHLVSYSRQKNTFQHKRQYLEYPDNAKDGFRLYIEEGLESLRRYLLRMEETLERLRPLAASCVVKPSPNDKTTTATPPSTTVSYSNNTIIVMFCSKGQVELFLNFVCSARARGLDTSQVLLFPADLFTKELAERMGIATFYDEAAFWNVPSTPSTKFGDYSFRRFMLTKVYFLHLISQLQYNILFQDADVVWNRHPLEYFESSSSSSHNDIGDFDMYFQDDGSRAYWHDAYHANGGFFYIRYNARTAYFLSNLIRQGDFILKKNEQIVMNVLLNEHASLTGLRVKTMNREHADFIGGWQYHHRPELMKEVMQGNVTPYVFHMSWTGDKKEKLQYLQQMGFWFVSEQCVQESSSSERLWNQSHQQDRQNHTLACCIAEPIVQCHYRNKPSKIPCRESPAMGEVNASSFW